MAMRSRRLPTSWTLSACTRDGLQLIRAVEELDVLVFADPAGGRHRLSMVLSKPTLGPLIARRPAHPVLSVSERAASRVEASARRPAALTAGSVGDVGSVRLRCRSRSVGRRGRG